VCDVDAVRKTVKLEELTFNSTILTDPSQELEFRLGALQKTGIPICQTMKVTHVLNIFLRGKFTSFVFSFVFTLTSDTFFYANFNL